MVDPDDAAYCLDTGCLSPALCIDCLDRSETNRRRDGFRWATIWLTMDADYVIRVSVEPFLVRIWCCADLSLLPKKAQLPTVDDGLSSLFVRAWLFSLPNFRARAATLPKSWSWWNSEPPQHLNYSNSFGSVSPIFAKSEKHLYPLTIGTSWLIRALASAVQSMKFL